MAAPSGQFKPGPYFLVLGVILAVLYSAVFLFGKSAAPKLGLDLQGGTSLTMTANTIAGGKQPTADNLAIARDIINQRVDSLGVAEADVTVEGQNIVVNVAGHNADPAKLQQLAAQAKLEFRTVLQAVADKPAVPAPAPSGSGAPSPSASSSTGAGAANPSPAPTPSGTPSTAPTPSTSGAPAPAPSSSAAPGVAATGQGITPIAQVKKTLGTTTYNLGNTVATAAADPSTLTADQLTQLAPFGKLSAADVAALPPAMQFYIPTITCQQLDSRVSGVLTTDAAIKSQVVSCSNEGGTETKYLLDAAKVHGEDISSASAGYDLANEQGWFVQLSFKGAGQAAWANLTSSLYQQYQSDGTYRQVAIVLDNETVTAPQILNAINGPAVINGGGMNQTSSKLLATQLKFGALPVSFHYQDIENTSATLGLQQLKAGLLAGGIGLALVVLYCLFYYRALGLVVIASLGMSAALSYAAIVLLGRTSLSFTLSLAGVAGFIVAIGITADSFVVFFERLKDEVREGKTARSAVPRAWIRARRTILSADAVSLIAAVVLVWLATGPVSSFAFTLGLSTLIDLAVVFLFTHPLVAALSGSKTFTSPRFSGLGDLRKARTTDVTAPTRFGSTRTKES